MNATVYFSTPRFLFPFALPGLLFVVSVVFVVLLEEKESFNVNSIYEEIAIYLILPQPAIELRFWSSTKYFVHIHGTAITPLLPSEHSSRLSDGLDCRIADIVKARSLGRATEP